MSNEIYIRQRVGNGPRVLRKITPTANMRLAFNSLKQLVGVAGGTVSTAPYAASGAIPISGGIAILSKTGSAGAYTLAAPVAVTNDGLELTIQSSTAFAHTVTQTTPGFNGSGAAQDVATFGGAIGDSMVVVAYNGVWLVRTLRNVTLA